MALENNDILYDVDIDLRDSLREIDQLQKKLKTFGDNLEVNATRVQKQMRDAAKGYVAYIRRLQNEFNELKRQGKDTSRHEVRLQQVRSGQRMASQGVAQDWARGGEYSRAAQATLQREITQMRSTTKELMGRYFDELNSAHLREVRRSLTNLRTEENLLRQRSEDRNFRAQHGDAAYGFRKQQERRRLNGGANQFMSQAGILNNYMMVGGLYGAGFYLGNFIAQLDKEFRQFQAITATTNTEMESMEDRLISVSEKTKFTALEVSQAATLMGQAGMSAAEVGAAIEPISLLATAAGTELKEAVDVVTSALNIFNLQSSEAGHLADVFTAALNESKLTLNQLTLALQYAGNIAATAGVSYNELTAAVGALANAGIRSGSTMGTGMRQMLVDLISPSKNLREELKALGLTLDDINIETHGLTGVMMNLREAGFGTTSAFEAFEVRAAAAYIALSNNIDTMAQLRQSFILSTAAAKANETQMEALINTGKKFGSNIGSLTYEAFRPYLAFLQDMVDLTADFIGELRGAGPIVEIVGTAIGSLVTAVILVRLGKLAAGLVAIGTGARGAAVGVGLLNGALLLNPIFLMTAGLTAAVLALKHFGDTAGRTAAQLDALEAKQDEYRAQIDRTIGRVESLDDALSDLIKKRRSLEEPGNEILRKTKIMEVVSSFQELAGSVDASSSSVGDLIKAIQELKGELVEQLPDQFKLLIAQIDEQIDTVNRAALNHTVHTGRFAANVAVSERFSNGGAKYGSELVAYNDDVAGVFGEKVAEAYKLLTSQTSLEQVDGQQAQGLSAVLERLIIETQRKLTPLNNKRGFFGTGLDDEEAALRSELNENLRFLQSLSGAFKPLANYLIELQSLGSKRESTQNDLIGAQLQGTFGYKNAGELRNQAEGFLTRGLSDVARTDDTIGGTKEAYDKLESELQKRLEVIETELTRAAEELGRTTDFTEEEISNALKSSKIHGQVAELKNALTKGSKNAQEAYVDFMAYLLKREEKSIKGDIDRVKKSIKEAQTERELDFLETRLYELDKKLAETEFELFETDPDNNVGENEADLEIAKRQIRDGQKDRRSDLTREIIKRRQELAEKANELYIDNLEAELSNTEDEMSALVKTIDEDSTADMIRTVAEKLEELTEKAKRLASEIASINVSTDFGAFGTGGLPTASANDIQKQIIAEANRRGIPAMIALAIASFESGFNPKAANPNSSAQGIYQNTDANWASHNLAPTARGNIEAQIRAGILDMLRTQEVLGTTQLSFQDYYGAHLLGQQGYQKVRNSPNANAVELLGRNAVLNNGGNAQQTAAEFAAMVTEKAAAHLNKVKHLVESPLDAAEDRLAEEIEKESNKTVKLNTNFNERVEKATIKKAVTILDEAAKSIEGEINTLMVQSSKVIDPDTLQGIIEQVQTKWAEMAEKELEAFRVENEGTDGYEERLKNLDENLNSALSRKIVTLLDRYQSAVENLQYAPLMEAQAHLAAAQNPLHANRFTPGDIASLENNVLLQERAAQMEKLNQLTQLHTYILEQVAQAEAVYGENSQQVQLLKERQFAIEQSLTDRRRQATADTEAAARSELTMRDAIEAANRAWMQRNGLIDSDGRMITAAEQAGEAWGQVLDTLTSGFETLFMDLAMGTESAEEAFKKFGLSVIRMLMQIIAKQMALNMVQSLMGVFGGGDAWGGMRVVTGATGHYIAGIKRAAGGEYITGMQPFRDSEYRKVMPGEMILRTSAVNQIGREALEEINARGNRKVTKGMPTLPTPEPRDSRPINIYAVLPEEQQQIGPDDVVAFITDDIRRRGMTRTLIKAVNTGQL